MNARELVAAYPKGREVECFIRKVEPVGVFVSLADNSGVSGRIRAREWSWERRNLELDRFVQIGEKLRVRVIGYQGKQLELSRRLSLPNPFHDFRKQRRIGDTVTGQVKLLAHKEGGVLLTLENVIDGFIPRSELPDRALRQEGFGLLIGDWLRARILAFKDDEVTLSVKEYLRLRDRVDSSDEERAVLRSHPTVGLILEEMRVNYQLQEISEPQISDSLYEKVRRVLIVEDNEGVSESLDLIFEHYGLASDIVRSIDEARSRLREISYDLLVLDINIPEEKGDKLIADLRTGESPPYVFVLTAAPEGDWSTLIGAGEGLVAGFFQKPTSGLRLLEHLSALIEQRTSLADDRDNGSGLGGVDVLPEEVARRRDRGLPAGRREMIEACLRNLGEEVNATRVCVLSYHPGSIFGKVAGDFPELTREVQQDIDVSPIGTLLRRGETLIVPDVPKRTRKFKHLLRILPVGSFAGCHLGYRDDAEYGLFILGDQPNQLRHVSEDRLRTAATLVSNLIAEEKLESVVTANQGLLLTGFLADSLLHEIKNAVQALDGYSAVQTRLAKRHKDDLGGLTSQESTELKKATLGIQGVTQQLNDLVLLFRNLAGAAEVEEIELGPTLRRLLQVVKPLADDKGVALEDPVLDQRIGELRLEPKLLDQALLNILINGIEQMEAGGVGRRTLRVTAEFHPEREMPIVLAISDTGPGIHTVHQDRIFDLFFTTKKRGTGLGLYVSRAFVAQLGGTLRLRESYLYAGSIFLVELPRKVLA